MFESVLSETRPTVLVIERDVLIRMSIAQYLRECGYRVIESGDAADLQVVLDAKIPLQVVFMEVQGGEGLDGFGIARNLRQTHPDIDVILTSGIEGAARKSEDLCEEGPIGKPYHPKDVAERIKLLLERRRSSKDTGSG